MTTAYIIRHAHKEQGGFYSPLLRHQAEPISQQGQAEARKLWSYLCEKQVSAIPILKFGEAFMRDQQISASLRARPARRHASGSSGSSRINTSSIQMRTSSWSAMKD